MISVPRPPGLSRRLLELASRSLQTPDLVDDADDLFAERARTQDLRAARRWYRRQAVAALGRVVRSRLPHGRPRPSCAWGATSLDVKLGVRMLVRYPGLTAVAVIAMAFSIFIGAGLFEVIDQTFPNSRLPLPGGERVVGLRYWDRAANTPAPVLLGDLRAWRDELTAIGSVGGFRTVTVNLFADDADQGGPITTAVMSPVGFQLAGETPLLGRTLAESDLARDAPPVVVIGFRVWQTRFGGDPTVVGRTVRLDDRTATVVGVMREGFRFPISHSLWIPLRLDEAAPAAARHAAARPGAGTGGNRRALDRRRVSPRADGNGTIAVFGRLKDGVSMARAQVELNAGLTRAAADDPERFDQVVGEVLPYRQALFSRPMTLMLHVMIYQLNAFAALFLMLVSANIALLMFARAASRERELLVRTALGASRRRTVRQLFVEALVLSAIATMIGLAAVGPGLRWLEQQMVAMGGDTPPFWFQSRLSAPTAVYAGVLAVLAALIAGVVPALKATGRIAAGPLGRVAAGGGGLRFGGIWSAVVVAQIAATVVFAGGALLMVQQARRSGTVDATFPADQYLSMRVDLDATNAASSGYRDRLRQLEIALAAEPGVTGVTVARQLPLTSHPNVRVEVDTGDGGANEVARAEVGIGFFDVFGARILEGRGFTAADEMPGARVVVVDEYFVESMLGGRSAIGRRIRQTGGGDEPAPDSWHTIVGVVRSLESDRPSAFDIFESPRPFVYRPLPADATGPLRLAAHVPAGPVAVPARSIASPWESARRSGSTRCRGSTASPPPRSPSGVSGPI